jgi:hypothetical protein
VRETLCPEKPYGDCNVIFALQKVTHILQEHGSSKTLSVGKKKAKYALKARKEDNF